MLSTLREPLLEDDISLKIKRKIVRLHNLSLTLPVEDSQMHPRSWGNFLSMLQKAYKSIKPIECVGWRRHSSLIILILLFTKPNIEVSGWLYQTKTHIYHSHCLSTFFKSVASILHTLCNKPKGAVFSIFQFFGIFNHALIFYGTNA